MRRAWENHLFNDSFKYYVLIIAWILRRSYVILFSRFCNESLEAQQRYCYKEFYFHFLTIFLNFWFRLYSISYCNQAVIAMKNLSIIRLTYIFEPCFLAYQVSYRRSRLDQSSSEKLFLIHLRCVDVPVAQQFRPSIEVLYCSKLTTSSSIDLGLNLGLILGLNLGLSSGISPVAKKTDGKNVVTTDSARTSQVGLGFPFSLHQSIMLSVPIPHFSITPAR